MNAKHDLAEALCQLLETKTLEKITVKDIVARCGVNRQTFYYHFHDVYDLMRWIFEREAANLAQTVREAGGDWRQELHTITDVLRSKAAPGDERLSLREPPGPGALSDAGLRPR